MANNCVLSLEKELNSDEYYLYKRWCEAVHDVPGVAATLQDKFENINVSSVSTPTQPLMQ